jgi:hypothetical protein
MSGERSEYSELMTDAHRSVTALDGITTQDGSKTTAAAVSDGRRVYERLLDYRGSVRMTVTENAVLQSTLDLLRARLRFFGEPV